MKKLCLDNRKSRPKNSPYLSFFWSSIKTELGLNNS